MPGETPGTSPVVRIDVRTLLALLLVPQLASATLLIGALLYLNHDGALQRRVQSAGAEMVTPSPGAAWPVPAKESTEPLQVLLESLLRARERTAPTSVALRAREPLDLKPLLDRMLTPDGAERHPLEDWRASARETTEALAARLSGDLGEAWGPGEGLALGDGPAQDRLGEVRALLADLQGLQGSLAQLREGGGASGAGQSLQQLGPAIAQIMPLLNALQGLRGGGAGGLGGIAALGGDRAGLDLLDQFLGRDTERQRRLGLLVLLAWMLDNTPESTP